MRLDDACDILGVVRVRDPHTRLPRIQGTRDEAQKLYRKLARSVLTRASRSLRAVRMGYAYQPPACCTYRRRRAARPEAQRTARVPASAYRTYRVPWHHRRCCTIRTAGARTPCLAQHARRSRRTQLPPRATHPDCTPARSCCGSSDPGATAKFQSVGEVRELSVGSQMSLGARLRVVGL